VIIFDNQDGGGAFLFWFQYGTVFSCKQKAAKKARARSPRKIFSL
jgi:hypothetical protein